MDLRKPVSRLGLLFTLCMLPIYGSLDARTSGSNLMQESQLHDNEPQRTDIRSGLRFSGGVDLFNRVQTEISGINALSLFYQTPSGFYIGNSVYSAAFGTAGGLFVGGIESGWIFPVSRRLDLQLGFFGGGGGGASQVEGDGLMLRSHLSVSWEFVSGWQLNPGFSYTHITGSPISTGAVSLAVSRDFELALSGGHTGRQWPEGEFLKVATFKPTFRQYIPQGSRTRGGRGRPINTMNTIGAEVTFSRTASNEVFIQTYGVFSGDSEGYADWLLGYRHFLNLNPIRLSASVAAGTGGGGDVNTGGGMVMMGGVGLEIPLTRQLGLEFEYMSTRSFNGDFFTLAPGARIIRYLNHPFRDDDGRSYRWAANSGMVLQIPNSSYRNNPENPNPLVFMIEAAMDLYFSSRFYVTGRAFTSFIGDAGGYQIGLLGPGYRFPVYRSTYVSGEIYIGAGGGAGVATRGGLLTGGRVSIDFPVWRSLAFSAGAGTLTSVLAPGMNPVTIHTGIRIPFTSHH